MLLWFYFGRLHVSGLWGVFLCIREISWSYLSYLIFMSTKTCIWQWRFFLFLLQGHCMLFCLISVEEVTLGYSDLSNVVCVHICLCFLFFYFRCSCQCHSQTINYYGCSYCTLSLNTAVATLTIHLYGSQSGGWNEYMTKVPLHMKYICHTLCFWILQWVKQVGHCSIRPFAKTTVLVPMYKHWRQIDNWQRLCGLL